jgi:hypothetical protein
MPPKPKVLLARALSLRRGCGWRQRFPGGNAGRFSKNWWQSVAVVCLLLALLPQASLRAQPTATNRVLRKLDGKKQLHRSCLRQTSSTPLNEATVGSQWIKVAGTLPEDYYVAVLPVTGAVSRDTGIEADPGGALYFFISEKGEETARWEASGCQA